MFQRCHVIFERPFIPGRKISPSGLLPVRLHDVHELRSTPCLSWQIWYFLLC